MKFSITILLVCVLVNASAQKPNCRSHYDRALKKIIFYQVTEEPQYPGGASEQMRFISENLKLPEPGNDGNVQSTFKVRLVLDADGLIKFADIDRRGKRELTAQELSVLQAINKMPKWIPAKCDGQAVMAEFVWPLFVCYSEESNHPLP